jgi:hypothetical protein
MRKINIPLMRRHIRTFGHEAHIAKIAAVDHFPELVFVDAIQLTGSAFINQIKQARESGAKIDAAAASLTNIENALHFLIQTGFVIKIRIFPVNGMTFRCFETAFTSRHKRVSAGRKLF